VLKLKCKIPAQRVKECSPLYGPESLPLLKVSINTNVIVASVVIGIHFEDFFRTAYRGASLNLREEGAEKKRKLLTSIKFCILPISFG